LRQGQKGAHLHGAGASIGVPRGLCEGDTADVSFGADHGQESHS